MKADITVVSLGPGDPDLLNQKTVQTVRSASDLVVLTEKHLFSRWLHHEGISFTTLDRFFESSEDFDTLHASAASYLWEKAIKGPVVFAVPDAVSDQTVRMLYRTKPENGCIEIVPGTGYQDIYLSASMPWITDSDFRYATPSDLLSAEYNPNVSLLIPELDNELTAGRVKLFLSDLLDDEREIVLLQGTASVSLIRLYELDRQAFYNHQTAVFIPSSDFMHRTRFVLQDLIRIMEYLRSPEGCPWDRKQTHRSLRPFLAEEAWECIASIDQEDMDHLSEELGDLLFQIVFHSSIGRSFDEFTLVDVVTSICLKMIRRHPHVFAESVKEESESSPLAWEAIKRMEAGHPGISESLNDVPEALPALKYAAKILKKLSPLNVFSRSSAEILSEIRRIADKIEKNESDDLEKKLGILLLLCTELCLGTNTDGELLLHRISDQLKLQIQSAESSVKKEGKTIESLTFRELGVYLSHVEGEIE